VALRLINDRTGATVASHVELALDRSTRRRGLLGRAALAPMSAMLFSPCWMVHTAFMQFPIDVLFLDAAGCIVHIARDVAPWRAAMSARARTVIELPAQSAAQCAVIVGDRVALAQPAGDASILASKRTLPLEVRAC
jgi:uncharacterized membrane protein (UPF0127 family)